MIKYDYTVKVLEVLENPRKSNQVEEKHEKVRDSMIILVNSTRDDKVETKIG